ncbi:hypothetical protein [Bilophila sp.]|uniref:hypothetical protein n=1 Tax=Bilophila sp. TaxID=1929485 RepID=UPI003076EAD3
MAFEFGSENRWYDQYFGKDVALPSTTSKVCDTPLAVGQHHGSLAVTIAAKGAVSIPSTKKLTVTIQGADTEDGSFADIAGAPEMSISGGTSAATEFADGDIMGKLVLPDMARYAKIKLTTDGAATGKVDVFLSYLAR